MNNTKIKVGDEWVNITSLSSLSDLKSQGVTGFYVCENDVNLLLRKMLFSNSSVECVISKDYHEMDRFKFKFK
ncbi:MAG: hypothetical protein MUQ75_00855 [Crocinitomicaceae bacterium]|nr:hypothetical protein [Crocinitomicaceae bacterium]